MRYRWISRLLGNARIEVDAVMAPHGREVLARLAEGGRRIVLMIDQTRATERHQVVMVAARAGGRALPLAWRVQETGGGGGLAGRRGGPGAGARPPPPGAGPGLVGGRLFGGAPPLPWCRPPGC